MKVKENYDLVEWRLNDKTGEALTDNKTFTTNTTVFAVSKEKAKEQVTITVKGDAGVNIVPENTFTTNKNAKWGDIKTTAKAKMSVKANYEFVEWRLNDKTGDVLTDDKRFEQDTTVFAVSKEKGPVTITLQGDERIDLSSQIEKPYNTTWVDIKVEIEKEIKPTEDWKSDWDDGIYAVYEWRLGGENGEEISDNYHFTDNITVYAVSNYMKWKRNKNELVGYDGKKPRGKIIVPDKVTSIGNDAFFECSSLTTITIPASVTSIGEWAFSGCSSLTTITIPDSVTSIKDGAFFECSSLISITIPNGVTSIGEWAFSDCSSLTTITIPASVTSIGWGAFSGCSSLTTITIPDSVTSIGEWAFGCCANLTTFTVNSGNTVYKSEHNIIYTKDGTRLIAVASGLTGTIDIPAGVTSIGEGAFFGCSALTGITIPDSVTSIGEYAFFVCSSLTTITIPDSVTTIEGSAFAGCLSLTTITIPASVTSIKSGTFEKCSSLESIEIPASVTEIDQMAFYDCRSLDSVTFADPKGWAVYRHRDDEEKLADIEESELKDEDTAAYLLREKYCDVFWKKN